MISISILILILAMALPSININLNSSQFLRITSIVLLYAGVLTFNTIFIQSIGSGIGIYNGMYHVTLVSQLIEVLILVVGALILFAWPAIKTKFSQTKTVAKENNVTESYEENNQEYVNIGEYASEYSLIVLFSTLGSLLLISSADIISMYLSIELQSFGLYILASLYRNSENATSAGLKYFLLGGLSSCIILLGAGLIYAFTGLTNFEAIYTLSSVSDSSNIIQGLSLGIILIFVGFLFKISAAPLHNWAPDVYDDSPTIVTIWLTIMAKISIIVLLLEFQTQIGFIGGFASLFITSGGFVEILNTLSNNFFEIGNGLVAYPITLIDPSLNLSTISGDLNTNSSVYVIKNLLLVTSLLSLIVGTVVGLAQTKVKRLLAYSTISHVGFMLLALAINTEQSIDSLLFYLIQYTLTNLNVFLIIIGLSYVLLDNISTKSSKNSDYSVSVKDIKFISEFKGQFFKNPILSISLTICLFSMAGTPPFIGFFSKQFVLYSAIQSGYYFMAIVAIIVSVVSASYYLKIIKVLHTEVETDQTKIENNDSTVVSVLTNNHSFLISSLTLTILLFILKPSLVLNSTQLLALSLFNF
jgi:NADH-ubiquinone oxidoreductase chain 2